MSATAVLVNNKEQKSEKTAVVEFPKVLSRIGEHIFYTLTYALFIIPDFNFMQI